MSHLHSRAGELKSQGAVEAAQSPESKISAEDAENVITAESKKAGVAAFQFDPDASPEDKAAQVRSVGPLAYTCWTEGDLIIVGQHVPPGFHHEKKLKAVGIVTDIVRQCCLLGALNSYGRIGRRDA